MAKVRELKNEVNYLTYEIVSDCNTFMAIHPDKRDKAMELVEKAVELRNNLIQKINNPKEVSKSYFKGIKQELLVEADKIFEALRKLIK